MADGSVLPIECSAYLVLYPKKQLIVLFYEVSDSKDSGRFESGEELL
jgi:hypothetical protein